MGPYKRSCGGRTYQEGLREEMVNAIKKMKPGKAARLLEVNMEMLTAVVKQGLR